MSISMIGLRTIFAIALLSNPINPSTAETSGTASQNSDDWRALFQTEDYNKPCPLTVYSEDLSAPVGAKQATSEPAHTQKGAGVIGTTNGVTKDD